VGTANVGAVGGDDVGSLVGGGAWAGVGCAAGAALQAANARGIRINIILKKLTFVFLSFSCSSTCNSLQLMTKTYPLERYSLRIT
jgi:hypothetical protein